MEINNIMDDTEIKIKGIKALYESLGSAAAMRFLTLLHKTPTDYVEISKNLCYKPLQESIKTAK
jgi:hypothetical protein